MISDQIYKRDTAGKIRVWAYEVQGDQYRTIAGIANGNLVTSAWTTCTSRNAGKANYQTAFEQALNEAEADEKKKLRREYRRTIAELDDVMQGPMLAATYKGGLKFPVFSQPKLDGIRALISEKGAFTRELQPHFNVAHIMEDLSSVFKAFPGIVLDGELYNHDLKDNFNRICQLVRKQTVSPEQRSDIERLVQFHIYDIANDKESFGQRALAMESVSRLTEKLGSIRWVPTTKWSSQNGLDANNAVYTSQGYEGQMVRLDAPYEFDARSKSLLKRKEFDTSEFKLLKIEEGEGNWAGYAKRIEFELEDGRVCGGGVRGNQDEMKQLMLLGMAGGSLCPTHVTVRYFKRTPDGMPRFPVAIDFHNGRVD